MPSVDATRRHLSRSLALLAALLVGGDVSRAQSVDGRSAVVFRDAFLDDMEVVHRKLMALAQAIPEDKYGWQPTPEVRTVSNVLMHVAMEWYYILPASTGGAMTSEWPSFPEARTKLFAITAKKDVLVQLDRAWTYGRAQVAAATASQILGSRPDSALIAARVAPDIPPFPFPKALLWIQGDQHEHLGQLITYARSVGVTPPWSR